ncbi:phosphopantetheine-binding protein [Campylobacter sp. VicNov18]|uniref:phosphopantetheine-binding protein n=1 Tax=Campylobacter bilis TaxID=2691918 RepID=UPI00130E7417|nr:phosphopantetheine-binding protein [Campylobacter bilis]MPV64069.1 acyl carrier protein [Campylobacter hepaticus]MBM0637572.1 acyl carrier protein [Campylobacter bilis]MCC8278298.1 phosphopantetheine-binding protein [Campylobacter bilis]MCC8299802.1 phosphopantetheine-binding protein [Campylobacter bilis]MCC8301207.1 phosphopantetheine-binding protein [Campylobacter bilis]
MEVIKKFFINIERADIDETMQNLISEDIIDSIDIMALVAQIEKHYGKSLNAEFITPENFENFQSIKNMITKAYQ